MKPALGSIGWIDMATTDAGGLRDFYSAVVGWSASEIPMAGGSYADYCMHPPGADTPPVAGICHARGSNADIPPGWLIYITVADLDASVAACIARGGSLVRPISAAGPSRIAIIRDPAGCVAALYQSN
jgi:uncharacterized protein